MLGRKILNVRQLSSKLERLKNGAITDDDYV